MDNTFPIYVIHYTKHTKRKKFLTKMLEIENIKNVNWVEIYDRETVLYEDYRDNFNVTEGEFNHRQPAQFPWGLHKLKPEEVSLCLKHKTAMHHFIKSPFDYALILEDDIILEHNFLDKLNTYITELPERWEVAFIGQAVDKRIPEHEIVDGVHWYKKTWPADKCTDSFLIRKSAAYKIIAGMNNRGICFPIDHELAYWFREMNINVYWLEPPITAQGSQCGIFDSFQEGHSRYYNENFKNIRTDIDQLVRYMNG